MEKKARRKLEPCPFCGGQDITIENDTAMDDIISFDFYVVCHSCDSSTGAYRTRTEAVAAWNKRA